MARATVLVCWGRTINVAVPQASATSFQLVHHDYLVHIINFFLNEISTRQTFMFTAAGFRYKFSVSK